MGNQKQLGKYAYSVYGTAGRKVTGRGVTNLSPGDKERMRKESAKLFNRLKKQCKITRRGM